MKIARDYTSGTKGQNLEQQMKAITLEVSTSMLRVNIYFKSMLREKMFACGLKTANVVFYLGEGIGHLQYDQDASLTNVCYIFYLHATGKVISLNNCPD